MTLDGDSIAVDRLSVGIENLEGDVRGLVGAVGELGRNAHIAVVARGDVKGVTLEIEVSRGGDEADVSEESAAGVPTGVAWLAGIGDDLDEVVLAVFQSVAEVNLEAHVAVVCATHGLAVEQHVGGVHDALKVEEHTTAFPVGIGGEVVTVITFTHLLETATRQTALDIRSHIGIVGFLICCRCHPGLFNLEVVRHVDLLPLTFVVQSEFPTGIQTFCMSLCRCAQRHQHSR